MRYVSIVPNKISPSSIFDLISDLLLYNHLNLLPEKNVFGFRPVLFKISSLFDSSFRISSQIF